MSSKTDHRFIARSLTAKSSNDWIFSRSQAPCSVLTMVLHPVSLGTGKPRTVFSHFQYILPFCVHTILTQSNYTKYKSKLHEVWGRTSEYFRGFATTFFIGSELGIALLKRKLYLAGAMRSWLRLFSFSFHRHTIQFRKWFNGERNYDIKRIMLFLFAILSLS